MSTSSGASTTSSGQGGYGLIGGIIASGASYYSAYGASKANKRALNLQSDANLDNMAEAQRNREFQERMTRNKHTYEVEDLIRAGLNPILSATAGSAVPSGSMATAKSAGSQYAQSQIAKSQMLANIASTASDIALKYKMAKTEESKAALNMANADKARGQVSVPGFYSGPASRFAQSAKQAGHYFRGVPGDIKTALRGKNPYK